MIAELAGRDALERARPDGAGIEALVAAGVQPPDVHLYVRSDDEFDLRARMFSPLDGIPEDPATGSANCAFAALLAQLDRPPRQLRLAYRPGRRDGPPERAQARADKRGGEVVGAWIGGECVMVSEGSIEV